MYLLFGEWQIAGFLFWFFCPCPASVKCKKSRIVTKPLPKSLRVQWESGVVNINESKHGVADVHVDELLFRWTLWGGGSSRNSKTVCNENMQWLLGCHIFLVLSCDKTVVVVKEHTRIFFVCLCVFFKGSFLSVTICDSRVNKYRHFLWYKGEITTFSIFLFRHSDSVDMTGMTTGMVSRDMELGVSIEDLPDEKIAALKARGYGRFDRLVRTEPGGAIFPYEWVLFSLRH